MNAQVNLEWSLNFFVKILLWIVHFVMIFLYLVLICRERETKKVAEWHEIKKIKFDFDTVFAVNIALSSC